ncbi:MAG: hypothetical protein ACM3MB_03675 [Acidobacteriota bacterium]
MKRKIINLQIRLYLFSAIILLIGLGGAALIYRRAADDSSRMTGYEIVDGNAYPMAPENSKMYIHDLEVFGGKSAVLADEFRRWFAGLWQGRSLAFTIACSTVLISLGFFLAAARLPSHLKSDARDENKRVGTG